MPNPKPNKFSLRHYEFLAKVLGEHWPMVDLEKAAEELGALDAVEAQEIMDGVWVHLCEALTYALAKDNPNFDAKRFLDKILLIRATQQVEK